MALVLVGVGGVLLGHSISWHSVAHICPGGLIQLDMWEQPHTHDGIS